MVRERERVRGRTREAREENYKREKGESKADKW